MALIKLFSSDWIDLLYLHTPVTCRLSDCGVPPTVFTSVVHPSMDHHHDVIKLAGIWYSFATPNMSVAAREIQSNAPMRRANGRCGLSSIYHVKLIGLDQENSHALCHWPHSPTSGPCSEIALFLRRSGSLSGLFGIRYPYISDRSPYTLTTLFWDEIVEVPSSCFWRMIAACCSFVRWNSVPDCCWDTISHMTMHLYCG